MQFYYRDVNTAFDEQTRIMAEAVEGKSEYDIVEKPSRNGPVLRWRDPHLMTHYHPRRRVLLFPGRNANPFFHVFESVWMLEGRNDLAPLTHFVKTMADFSDDGLTLYGAYGYRWRNQFGFDQIVFLIQQLHDKPDWDRRLVLQMWDPGHRVMGAPNFHKESDQLIAFGGGKDVPCNTACKFSVVDGELDMTVENRSNDLIWGSLGANIVHFSYLQEYLAGMAGLGLGRLHQMSTNLHLYVDRFDLRKLRQGLDWENLQLRHKLLTLRPYPMFAENPYQRHKVENDILNGTDRLLDVAKSGNRNVGFESAWFNDVAVPMMRTYHKFQLIRSDGNPMPSKWHAIFPELDLIKDELWREAAKVWIGNRIGNLNEKDTPWDL